ncbi:hypothetical protein [Kocuria aegyptia]|uniref:Uncharacterized protein n=1 Tax=Kocuria aegyptia TaxID=330943 RepID=A0ABP4X2E9_9MICC
MTTQDISCRARRRAGAQHLDAGGALIGESPFRWTGAQAAVCADARPGHRRAARGKGL